jgi:hypothetical protein
MGNEALAPQATARILDAAEAAVPRARRPFRNRMKSSHAGDIVAPPLMTLAV